MNHPAELAIHQYLENAANGRSSMSDETIDTVAREGSRGTETSVR